MVTAGIHECTGTSTHTMMQRHEQRHPPSANTMFHRQKNHSFKLPIGRIHVTSVFFKVNVCMHIVEQSVPVCQSLAILHSVYGCSSAPNFPLSTSKKIFFRKNLKMQHEFGGSKDVGYAKALFQNKTLKKCEFFPWVDM